MKIVKEPDQILHRQLKKIQVLTPGIKELVLAMKKTMQEANGIGLAASQVGRDVQVFVIDENLAKENNAPDVYIDPEVTESSKDQSTMEEGCLSLPNYWPSVTRPKKVKIKFMDEAGKKHKIKARGFLARVLQHEVDHLNGVLIKNKVKS